MTIWARVNNLNNDQNLAVLILLLAVSIFYFQNGSSTAKLTIEIDSSETDKPEDIQEDQTDNDFYVSGYNPISFTPKSAAEEKSYELYLNARKLNTKQIFLDHELWGKMTWRQFDYPGNKLKLSFRRLRHIDVFSAHPYEIK